MCVCVCKDVCINKFSLGKSMFSQPIRLGGHLYQGGINVAISNLQRLEDMF